MQHSLHIFIGDELLEVAEAINQHLTQHCDSEGKKFSHIATLCTEDNVTTIRVLDGLSDKIVLSNDTEGIGYFSKLHPKIAVAEGDIDVSSNLYVCLYVQAYNEASRELVNKVANWIKQSDKHYIVDIFGIAEDLAELFSTSSLEKNSLVYEYPKLRKNVTDFSSNAINLAKSNYIRHYFLVQGCNLIGLGLDLDKSTLIRIIGEYARFSTTNFNDLFPPAAINNPEIIGLGISAYWFNTKFFQSYIFSRCFVEILKRERVDQHKKSHPNQLLDIAKEYIGKYLKSLINDVSPSDTTQTIGECTELLDEANSNILNLINRTDLSLPEKRAIFAILLGADDELLDDSVLLKLMPTIDDCISDAANLFIAENNRMAEDGISVISQPRHEGKVYLPLEELGKIRTSIRQSHSFIRKSEKRLKEIEQEIKITHESKKRLTEGGFKYGDTTFRLQHDVVEQPLDETYQPKEHHKKSVDLRKGFSRIRNQKGLGACTAFSMASIFEFIINQEEPSKRASLSPKFLYYNVCEKNIDGTPIDKGSSFYKNIKSLGDDGICTETLCNYEEDFNLPPTDEAQSDAKTRLVTKAMNVDISHKALTSALSEGFPIGVSLKIFDSFGKGHKGFVFRPSDKELGSTDYGYHAMVLCGFSEKEKVYIVRNSWGLGFGDNGYCFIPFSYIEDTELCRQACIVTGVSCGEIGSASLEETDFNLSDKDIEYSVLRIKIDEEKVNQDKLKAEYEESYKNYMLLLADLSNKRKRDIIMNHALSRIPKEITESKIVETTQEVSTKKKLYFITCLFVTFLSIIAYFTTSNDDVKILTGILSSLGLWVSILVYLKMPTRINETKTQTQIIAINNPKYLSLENKYLFAGCMIDKFQELRNKITNKHKHLISFVSNLETWLREEEKNLKNVNEGLKKPFYSLFSDEQADNYLEEHSDRYINDFWLYKRFSNYGLSDKAIVEFKEKLRRDIEQRVSKIASSFSMSNFLLNMDRFPYLLNISHQTLFSTIENMSKPFIQTTAGKPSQSTSHILVCDADPESDDWMSLLAEQYTTLPLQARDMNTTKITYIQLQELKLDETLYGTHD